MGKVTAIVNQKGGVGKTTTVINLGACFARMGERVLLIDMDGQGNMSRGLGCKVKRSQYTIRNALVDIMNGVDVDPMKGIVPAKYDPLYIMPADKQLLAFERSLKNEPEAPYLLRSYVEKLQWSFDRILIDCSPSLGVLTQNALVASHSVMIPVDPEFFGMEGVEQITSTMNDVKRKMNPELYLEGIVIVRRNNVSTAKRTNVENLRQRYVWGAKGENKFDCSGLAYWSIKQVDPALGDRMYTNAAGQAKYCYDRGRTVARSELQPGDLVFWVNLKCEGCHRWKEIHHVGIYIGDGKVCEASSGHGRVIVRDLWESKNYPIYMFGRPYSD